MDNSLNPPLPVAPATQQLLPLLETSLRQSRESPSSSPADNGNPKLVVVIGMHRSGTSAVTRGLKTLGVELGDRLWPPNEAVNAKGFWEDMDINALNIEMMKALNTDWHYLSPIKQAEIEMLSRDGFLLRAAELLRAKVGDSARFGFKDPRVTKLLPFWKEVVEHCQYEGNYLLMTRHPLSVVESLRRRENFDAEKSYLLWLVHMLECIGATNGCRRVLVDFDRLMQDPDRELGRIAAAFALTVDPIGMATYKSNFLDESLRHTTFDPNEMMTDVACLPLVREVYSTLLSVAADELALHSGVFQQQLDKWAHEFARLEPTLALADKLWVRSAHLNAAVADKDRKLHDLGEQVASRTAEAIVREEREHTLNKITSERDAQIAGLYQARAAREDQVANINQALTEQASQIATLIQAAAEQERAALETRNSLEARLLAEQQDNIQLRQQLTDIHHHLAEIKRSLLWRMLIPFHKLGVFGAPRADLPNSRLFHENASLSPKISSQISADGAHISVDTLTEAANFDALMQHQGKKFIEVTYLTLLKRQPDEEGLNFYLGRLRDGVGKLQILHEICSSIERRDAGVELPGLREALSKAAAPSIHR